MPQVPYAIPVPPVVHILDDDETIREIVVEIARSLNAVPKSYARATEFLQSYRAEPVECLVIDLRMPDMTGLDVQRNLLERGVSMPILFVTGYGEVTSAVEAMRAGAMDYIQKPFSREALADKLTLALDRSREHYRETLAQGTVDARYALLTVKEREVALRVVAGKSSREIADEFGLSVRTIENHRARIMDKLHAESVVELVHLLTPRVKSVEG